MVTISLPPVQGTCYCCGKNKLVQANFDEGIESYEESNDYANGISYAEGHQKLSACHLCFVDGMSAQFDEWTDEEKLYFWNTGNYLEIKEVEK